MKHPAIQQKKHFSRQIRPVIRLKTSVGFAQEKYAKADLVTELYPRGQQLDINFPGRDTFLIAPYRSWGQKLGLSFHAFQIYPFNFTACQAFVNEQPYKM